MRITSILYYTVIAGFVLIGAGCEGRAAGFRTDARHMLKMNAEEVEALKEGLMRQAEAIAADIEGPLREEIADYFAFHISQLGPLVYHSRDYAESQIEKAAELPDQISKMLNNQLQDHLNQLLEEIATYGRTEAEDRLPELQKEYRRFMANRRAEVVRFTESVKRYERVNSEQLHKLSIDLESFWAWQKEKPKEIPDATQRYLNKISSDFEEISNSTGRMFTEQLTNKPAEMMRNIEQYAKYNTEEVLDELGRATGDFFSNQLPVSDLVKEMHCFGERNIETTERLMTGIGAFFDLNAEHANKLNEEVYRFFEWRTKQWEEMNTELSRYFASNTARWDDFQAAPIKYFRRQQEEWDILMETVPRYFISNAKRSEGLMHALRRYAGYNFGHPSHRH